MFFDEQQIKEEDKKNFSNSSFDIKIKLLVLFWFFYFSSFSKWKKYKKTLFFDVFWWVLMGFDRFWWVLVGFDGFWWVLMGFGGFRWKNTKNIQETCGFPLRSYRALHPVNPSYPLYHWHPCSWRPLHRTAGRNYSCPIHFPSREHREAPMKLLPWDLDPRPRVNRVTGPKANRPLPSRKMVLRFQPV